MALLPTALFGVTYAKWAVTDNADEMTINITPYAPGKKRVNYYLPKSDGSGFELYDYELVSDGGTLADVPTPGSITNYTFEKWSTSNALSDSFDTSTPITQGYDLYAAYYGYTVKGSSDANYTEIPASSGSIDKYKFNGTNDTTSFSYSYALLGEESDTPSKFKYASTRLQGSTIGVYKHYFATSINTLVESKTNKVTDGKFKVYFNPNGSTNNKLYFAKTFIFQIKNYDAGPAIHLWDKDDGSITTQFPGPNMSWLGQLPEESYQRKHYYIDIDTSMVNRFIVCNPGYNTHRLEFDIPSDTNNCRWNYQYDSNNGGWFELSPTEKLNS